VSLKETVNMIKEPLETVKNTFDEFSNESLNRLRSNIDDMQQYQSEIEENLDNCSDENTKESIKQRINDETKKIDGCWNDLNNEYTTKLEELKTHFNHIINTIIEDIQEDDISDVEPIKSQFVVLHDACKTYLDVYNNGKTNFAERMKECDKIHTDFENNKQNIQDQLIECIRDSIRKKLADAKTKFDPIQDKLAEPGGEFPTGITNGDGLIQQIDDLLQ